ncbi:hypothetical protein [Pararobbsia alpina]|uniref:hypothetical protein n=1 Tax=Pararobbsia alpina TaxID=621374 RepID=UPI0039A5E8F5
MLASIAVASLAGCSGKEDANKGNFSAAIQKFLDTSPASCAGLPKKEAPFWVEKEESILFADAQKKASALATAGLLSANDAVIVAPYGFNKKIAVTQYSLTDKGKSFLVKGGSGNVGQFDAFCGGKLTVKEISNFSKPSDAFGKTVTEVNFQFELRDAPDWFRDPAIQSAYPTTAVGVNKPGSGKAILVLTNDGWVHEALFQRNGG